MRILQKGYFKSKKKTLQFYLMEKQILLFSVSIDLENDNFLVKNPRFF